MKKQLLRTLVFTFSFSVFSLNLHSQWVTIPDAQFVNYLQSQYSSCMNGNLMDTTCTAIISDKYMGISAYEIRNFDGLQYFDSLEVFLYPFGVQSPPYTNSIPAFPPRLTNFEFMNGYLTSLPPLPATLDTLIVAYNKITSLPQLPESLELLSVGANYTLPSLPPLPRKLKTLYARGCDMLASLPELPDSMIDMDVSYCFNLKCLPELKTIINLDFSNTFVQCIPNYGNVTTSNPPLNTVPLCDIFNTKGCSAYWDIIGKVYADANMNCNSDAGESACKNIQLQLYENGILKQLANTTGDGIYTFDIGLSTYEYSVDTTNLPFNVICPASGYQTSVITALDSTDIDKDFSLQCKPGFDLVAQNIEGRFRIGNIGQLNISAGDLTNFYGAHCAAGISGSVQLVMSGPVSYIAPVSGALAPTNVSGDTVTWNIPDFGAVNFFSDFNIMLQTDTNAQLGSLVCFSLVVNPIAGDNNPSNNALDYCGVVVGSFDPNEKEVYPAGNIDTAQKWLTYTIHFQNTGTAEAQHIYVTDTLDSNVDPASFQLLAYSHQPMVQIKENAVRFNFPNINLPDSNTNEPLSHGYVQYKVKLKNNLPLGTNISNTAFIYFDFNAPVVTNTTTNTITTATALNDVRYTMFDVRLFPNPSSDLVNMAVDEAMVKSKLTITDITGRKVTVAQIENRISRIETSAYPNGIYFVTVENEKGRVTKKLVVQ